MNYGNITHFKILKKLQGANANRNQKSSCKTEELLLNSCKLREKYANLVILGNHLYATKL